MIPLLVVLQACVPSFKFNGSSIDYNKYKTVSIGEFPIRAALVYPPLQQLIENTKARDYTNAEEIQKIYRVMEA